jgi:hypothetical protein
VHETVSPTVMCCSLFLNIRMWQLGYDGMTNTAARQYKPSLTLDLTGWQVRLF